ncbi:hypothetical protein [Roseateles chitinivorans]|uniref:hypothetical protein n=1 Tax=Roseateles chitinivorans TaxID=2917965 RepID=UPI003D679155
MSSQPTPTIPTTAMKVKGVLASVVGGVTGIYAGLVILAPLAFTGVAWFIGSKLLKPRVPTYLPAIAIQIGHLCWLALGMAILGTLGANFLDVVMLGIGVTWLWLRPGLWPVVLLTAFQVLGLVVNVMAIAPHSVGSLMHKALVVHIAWRLAAMSYMWWAYLGARRQSVPSIEEAPAS